jgi:hypothetical protein
MHVISEEDLMINLIAGVLILRTGADGEGGNQGSIEILGQAVWRENRGIGNT